MNNNPTAGITRPFLREERYYVLKISDMRKYLSREKFEFVGAIAEKLNAGRAVDGKTVLQAVVVEHDWPEYERVWQMIETRMSTTRRQFLNCNNDRRFWAIPESDDETEALGRRRWQCKCGTRYWVTLTKCHCPSCGQAAVTAKTDEIDRLRKALLYVAYELHATPQHMLAKGITLIDGDTVRVSIDGWVVEASDKTIEASYGIKDKP